MAFRLDIHHYFHIPQPEPSKIDEILAIVKEIQQRMTTQYDNLIESMNTVGTNLENIAEDISVLTVEISALQEQIANGLTPEQAVAAAAKLEEIKQRAIVIAAIINPAIPPEEIPTPTPEEPETPTEPTP